MGKKIYQTEEERKAAHRESSRRCYQKHKEKMLEYFKQYYREHKEEIVEYKKQWRESNPEYHKQYYQNNKEKLDELNKQYRQEHKEELAEWNKQYRQTPMGRAKILYNSYCRHDKNAGRGECTLTPEWIMENIFTQKCHWCPETDWMEMGCDRIDNSLPHTPDNVIPCCERCNKKRGRKTYEEFEKALRAEETVL